MRSRLRWAILALFLICSNAANAQPVIAQLADSVFRTGETLTLTGLNLWYGGLDSCERIFFNGTGANDHYFYAVVGDYGGSAMMLNMLIQPVLPCDSYLVRVEVVGAPCGSAANSNFIRVHIKDSVSVSYPGTGIYCLGDSNPLPVSFLDTALYQISSGPPGAFVNDSTGEVAIQSGGLGPFTVLAYTSTSNFCNDTQEVVFNINPMVTSNVGYRSETIGYCPRETVVGPLALPSPPGGMFTSIPQVVWADDSLGHVRVDSTPPGFYTLIYNPPHDACAYNDTVPIRINAKYTPAFDYAAQYCLGDTTAYPAITNLPPGHFESVPPTAALDPNTGAFNLTNPGASSYTISYLPDSACSDTVDDFIGIYNTPQAFLEFDPDTVCKGVQFTGPNLGTLFPSSGGTFRDTSGYVSIHPNTGQINVDSSTAGGPYYVFYTNGDPTCPDSVTAPITILARDSFSVFYPKSQYCRNEADPSAVFGSGPTGGRFISTPSASLLMNDSTGLIDLSSSQVGSYLIQYISPNADCQDTIPVDSNFVINAVANSFFNTPNGGFSETLCEGSGNHELASVFPGATSGYVVTGPGGPYTGVVVGDSIVTSALPPGGPYAITRWVQNGACIDSTTRYITIGAREDASFYYVNDTLCGDATDPIPLITGDGGGTFSLDTTGTTFNNVDPNTGEVDLSLASGNFTIRYVTGGQCKDTAYADIVILPANSAEFHYFGEPKFCTRDSIILIDDSNYVFTLGGIFTYTPALPGNFLHINDSTGTILLDSSGTGEFSIRYSVTNAVCAQLYQTDITIFASDDSTRMYYVDSIFCPQDSVAPVLIGDSTGVFLAGPGINFLDTLGTIDLANSLPSPTPYYIRYFIAGDCEVDLVDSIEIQSAAPSTFTYSNEFFCTTDSNPIPSFIATPGGTFWAIDDSFNVVQLIDPQTGEFFLDQVSGNNVKYYIYYNSGAGCTTDFFQQVTVFQGPAGANLEPAVLAPICDGDFLRFTASGSEIGYQWFLNGDSIPASVLGSNQATFESNNFTDSSEVMVVFGNLAGCRDSLSRIVEVNPTPLIAIADTAITVSGDQTVDIEVVSFLDNSFLNWVAISQANITFDATDGREGPVDNGQSYIIQNQFGLTDSTSPALVVFTVTPQFVDCFGEPVSVYVKVNPDNQAIFVPEMITPNGDNLNDRWLIQLRNDIRAEDYTMLLFNRSGGQVLRMNPLNQDFNGGSLPDGVYWYKLLGPTGNTLRTGGLTIRRK